MKAGSLFTGIGGFDIGLERAGVEVVWQCEQDASCVRVLSQRFPNAEIYRDVRELDGRTIESVQLLCGGFPCQDLSVAGRRAGLAGERSGLFHEFMRLIDEITPRWVLLENVPGLLSSNEGRDMGTVVGSLAECGYGWAYRVLDSQFFGLAQRRKRVFIVGCRGNWTGAAKVLFDGEGMPGDSPPSREARPHVAAALTAGTATGSGVNRPGRRREDDVNLVAATLNSGGNNGGFRTEPGEHLVSMCLNGKRGNRFDGESETFIPIAFAERTRSGVPQVEYQEVIAYAMTNPSAGGSAQCRKIMDAKQGVRRLLPIECERLQGFDDGWTDAEGTSDSARYRQLGNAVSVPVAEWIARKIVEVDRKISSESGELFLQTDVDIVQSQFKLCL